MCEHSSAAIKRKNSRAHSLDINLTRFRAFYSVFPLTERVFCRALEPGLDSNGPPLRARLPVARGGVQPGFAVALRRGSDYHLGPEGRRGQPRLRHRAPARVAHAGPTEITDKRNDRGF
jgi:hypothetical protein